MKEMGIENGVSYTVVYEENKIGMDNARQIWMTLARPDKFPVLDRGHKTFNQKPKLNLIIYFKNSR